MYLQEHSLHDQLYHMTDGRWKPILSTGFQIPERKAKGQTAASRSSSYLQNKEVNPLLQWKESVRLMSEPYSWVEFLSLNTIDSLDCVILCHSCSLMHCRIYPLDTSNTAIRSDNPKCIQILSKVWGGSGSMKLFLNKNSSQRSFTQKCEVQKFFMNKNQQFSGIDHQILNSFTTSQRSIAQKSVFESDNGTINSN